MFVNYHIYFLVSFRRLWYSFAFLICWCWSTLLISFEMGARNIVSDDEEGMLNLIDASLLYGRIEQEQFYYLQLWKYSIWGIFSGPVSEAIFMGKECENFNIFGKLHAAFTWHIFKIVFEYLNPNFKGKGQKTHLHVFYITCNCHRKTQFWS